MAVAEQARLRPVDLIAEALRGTDDVVAVTGATGWFGAIALDLLYEALGEWAGDRVVAYASTASVAIASDGRRISVRPLVELVTQDPPPTTLLHFAFLTRDKVAALGVDSYASENVAITITVLDAVAKHQPRHVVAVSSGAVHSSTGRLVSDMRADPYGALKHLSELAIRAATRDAGGCCVIPRVFSVGGARMSHPGLYALGSMIEMALVGGPIEVAARGPVVRSYCGVDEVVALSLWAALSGRDVVFDTSGTAVEMEELARLVAQVHGLNVDVVRRTWDSQVAPDRYVGDGRIMDALAAEAGLSLCGLDFLVRETSDWLRAARRQEA